MAQQVTVEKLEEAPVTGVFPDTTGGTVSVAGGSGEKPVGTVPRPAAQPVESQVVLSSDDPVIPVRTEVKPGQDIAQVAGEDIAAKVNPSFDSILQSASGDEYMRLLSLQEDAEAGNADAQMRILSMTESTVPLTETVKPFVEDQKVVIPANITDPNAVDRAQLLGEQSIMLDNMLREDVPDARVRQVLVDNGLGNFGDVLVERLAEAGRGVTMLGTFPIGKSPMNTAAYYYGLSVYDWMAGRASSPGVAYASYGPEIQRDSQANLDAIAKVLPGPTIGMAANDFIRNQLQERVNNGLMTQEEYDQITTEIVDGQVIDRTLISDEAANNILQLSFNTLPLYERFGVIALENVVGMAGFGAATAMKGRSTLKAVRNLQKEFPELQNYTDPRDVLRIAQANKQARGLKMHFLNIGMREERIDAGINDLVTQTSRLSDELAEMRYRGVVPGQSGYATYVAKEQQLNVLESRLLRAKFTGRTIPMVRENVQNSLIISAGQLGAREILPMFTGFDQETSEFFGALSMSLGGYQAVKGLGRRTGRTALRFVDGNLGTTVTSGFGRVMDFFAFAATGGEVGRAVSLKGKSLFSDDGIKIYEESLGRRLSSQERRSINYATRLIQNMTDEGRATVLKATDDYLELQDRIVSKFPEGEAQDKARELFTLSFAQATSIGPMAALNNLAVGKIAPRALKNLNSDEMIAHTQASERQIAVTERALQNLQDHLDAVPDMVGKESVQEYISNGLNSLQAHKQNLRGDYEDTLAALDDLEKFVFDDVTVDLPENLFANILYTRTHLKEKLGQSVSMKQEIIDLQRTFEEGLARRMSIVEDMRGQGAGYMVLLGRTTEDMIDTHMESLFARGRAAYAPVVKFSEGRRPIDMTPLVEETIEKFGRMTDIENFFTAGGDFFSGKLGQQTQEVFDNMVRRVLPPEKLDQMRGALRAGGIDDKSLSDIEVAIRAEKASDALGIFSQANPYEVEIMRRAFRDYAYRLGPDDRELAKIAGDFATSLNNLIRTQDKDMYALLEQARQTYRNEVGDRLRPRQILTKIDNSRRGPEKVARGPNDPYRFAYADVDPVTAFRPIGNAVNGLASGGTAALNARQDMPRLMSQLTTDFGERKVVDGVMMPLFDLDTPEGLAKFNSLKSVISERVFADWGEKTLKSIQQPRMVTRTTLENRVGGYDFTRGVNWGDITDRAKVTVLKDGKVTTRPIFDAQAMISSENDIVRLMQNDANIRRKVQDFVEEASSTTSQLRRNADSAIANEKEVFDLLRPYIGVDDPDNFYKMFVTNGSLDKLDTTKSMAVELLQKSGKSPEEAADMFDMAAASLITRGLMSRGGLQNVSGRTFVGLDTDTKVVRQFTTPQDMLQDIQQNREILDAVLGSDHVSYLEDITEFLNMAADTTVATSTGFQGITRGYGTNELLSRIYNVARGMVSPLYVTSEAAVRLASQANVEMFQMIGQDANAARIVRDLFKYPELITTNDMEYLDRTFKVFVTKEMVKMGLRPSTYMLVEQAGTQENENNEDE
tara:strand:- start:1477 stop:6033 length:4557 start_codon:yes stop_codon:yes gene_type:complete